MKLLSFQMKIILSWKDTHLMRYVEVVIRTTEEVIYSCMSYTNCLQYKSRLYQKISLLLSPLCKNTPEWNSYLRKLQDTLLKNYRFLTKILEMSRKYIRDEKCLVLVHFNINMMNLNTVVSCKVCYIFFLFMITTLL